MQDEITGHRVLDWIEAMKDAGKARTSADCARLLGISATSMSTMSVAGVKGRVARRTRLAFSALLQGIEPYA